MTSYNNTSYQQTGPDFNRLVLNATNPKNQTDDWDSIMQISDLLCQNPDDYTRQVLPILLARLKDPNPVVVIYSLTLSDAILKNTNDYVKKCFLRSEFVNIVNGLTQGRSNDVKEKASEVIKENQLTQFPSSSSSPPMGITSSPQQQPLASSTTRQPPPFRGNTIQQPPSKLSTYQEKLDPDLTIVKENINLLGELVSAASSPNELKEDDTALQLKVNCEEMQRRIISLIETIPPEDVLLKLLEVNEALSDSLQSFEKFMKTGKKESPKLSQALNTSSAPPLSPNINTSSTAMSTSSGFGSLANRNTNRTNTPSNQNKTLSLDDFLGSSVQPTPPQQQFNSNVTPSNLNASSNSGGVNSNKVSTGNSSSTTPLSLDDLFGLTASTPVQPQQQRLPPIANNPSPYTLNNNPYSDSMEREFGRLNIQAGSNNNSYSNPIYPSTNPQYSTNPYTPPYNPYGGSDHVDPNDPFGLSSNRPPQQQQSNNQSNRSSGGFAALANRDRSNSSQKK
ncbi:hypothetical protein C9374_005774 [Naegleria lovaniensis]|uniref:GAT domain-containing protein n=1 Tax=Naegleria lovaniensis TaxID=51637 RepID=A0AA88GPF9_NAELO|nr:uncharacterized protein C9374_005774 [Naegleria lovaniensis]KAG2381982.1 hypothetical protein C9374_005774 [Naegleria lovaniensis]